jgi:pantothenate kinase, type III
MILCVDIGNSTVFMGLIDSARVIETIRISVKEPEVDARISEWLNQIPIDEVLMSSVVPRMTDRFVTLFSRLTQKKIFLLGKDLQSDMTIAIDNPSTLGSDRLADAVGASHDYPLPVIVIDFGTATTCSVINREGVFVGGTIGLGVKSSFDALTEKTAKLKNLELEPPVSVVGRNTQQCINSGIVFGHAALVDGLIDRIEAETNDKYTLVFAGGMAKVMAPYCKHKAQIDQELILKGLYYCFVKTISSK